MRTTVTRESAPERFEISVDGVAAGSTAFVDRDGRRIFPHTEIGEDFGGQGLAGQLVEEALTATREEGLTIVAVCPYVAKWLGKHPEFEDVTAKPTPEDLAVIGS